MQQVPQEAAESSGTEDSRGDDYLALAQRTQADFENYRKRTARELESAQSRGVARLARELVPTLDNLERALVAAAEAPDVDEQLIEGLRLVHRELLAALERAGIERFGEAGEGFDPASTRRSPISRSTVRRPGRSSRSIRPATGSAARVIRPARVLVAA